MEGKFTAKKSKRKRNVPVELEQAKQDEIIEEIEKWRVSHDKKRINEGNCVSIIRELGDKASGWSPGVMMEVWLARKQSLRSKTSYGRKKKRLSDAEERATVAEKEKIRVQNEATERLSVLEEEIRRIQGKAERKIERIKQQAAKEIQAAKENVEAMTQRVKEAEEALNNFERSKKEKLELERNNDELIGRLRMLEKEHDEGEERIRNLEEAVRLQENQLTADAKSVGEKKELGERLKQLELELKNARKEKKEKEEEIKEIATEQHALKERVRLAEESRKNMKDYMVKAAMMVLVPAMFRLVVRINESRKDDSDYRELVGSVTDTNGLPSQRLPDWIEALSADEVKNYVVNPKREIHRGFGEKRAYPDQTETGLIRFVRNLWAHPDEDFINDKTLYDWVDSKWNWFWPVLAMLGPTRDERLDPDRTPVVKGPIEALRKRFNIWKEETHRTAREQLEQMIRAKELRDRLDREGWLA